MASLRRSIYFIQQTANCSLLRALILAISILLDLVSILERTKKVLNSPTMYAMDCESFRKNLPSP